jgi:hypothetical protein
MREDGEWAGQPEMLAVAWAHRVSIWVHCDGGQPTYLIDAGVPDAKVIHISYHEGIHFNAVYPSPEAESAAAAATASAAHVAKGGAAAGKGGAAGAATTGSGGGGGGGAASSTNSPTADEKLVVSSTGCDDLARVRRVLRQSDFDVSAAIELLIDENAMSDAVSDAAAVNAAIAETGLEDALLAAAIEESIAGPSSHVDIVAPRVSGGGSGGGVGGGGDGGASSVVLDAPRSESTSSDAWSQFTAAIVHAVSPPAGSAVSSDSDSGGAGQGVGAPNATVVPTTSANEAGASQSQATGKPRQKPPTKREKKMQKKQQKVLERKADAPRGNDRGDGTNGDAAAGVTWDVGVAEPLVRM